MLQVSCNSNAVVAVLRQEGSDGSTDGMVWLPRPARFVFRAVKGGVQAGF